MIRKCVICGMKFRSLPYLRNPTCGSPACVEERFRQVQEKTNARISRRIQRPCVICGQMLEFPRCEAGHHSTCSPECRAQYFRALATERMAATRHSRTCPICGCSYQVPPSSGRQTCGRPECTRKLRHLRTLEHPEHLAEMQTAAAQSPLLQPDENNVHAREWSLRSPSGTIYRFRNLRHFIREHQELFTVEELALSSGRTRAENGLGRLRPTRLPHQHEWHGWTWAE